MEDHLSKLDQIQDPQIRFEMGNVLLYFLSKQGDPESDKRMERLLLEAVELNDYAGIPMLVNYYFQHYRFNDVIRICDEFLKTRVNASMPIMYGESCLLNGQPELIQHMADRIRGLRGRQSKVIASYLDALIALNNGDNEKLQTSMIEAGSTIDTPLSSLIRFLLAIYVDSPKEVLLAFEKIMRGSDFLDFKVRARTLALAYIINKISEEGFVSNAELLNTCAEIAALLETPGDDVSFLRRIVLLDHFKRNVMTEDELQSSLRSFPGDPVFLKIAAEYSLSRNQPDRALEYITEYNELDDVPDKNGKPMTVLHILALDQLGRKDEVQKELRTLVEKEKDDLLIHVYFDYCVENNYLDSLKSFAEWIETLPESRLITGETGADPGVVVQEQ